MVSPEEGVSELQNVALAQKGQHSQMLPLGWETRGWEMKVLESRQPGRWEARGTLSVGKVSLFCFCMGDL